MSERRTEAFINGAVEKLTTNINEGLETYIYCFLEKTGAKIENLTLLMTTEYSETGVKQFYQLVTRDLLAQYEGESDD